MDDDIEFEDEKALQKLTVEQLRLAGLYRIQPDAVDAIVRQLKR